MSRNEKIALAVLGGLTLVAGIIGAFLVWQHKQENKTEIIDGVIYGPMPGRVTFTLLIRDASASNKTEEREFDISLAQPVFNGLLPVRTNCFQVSGACRPMATTQEQYRVEFQIRPKGSDAEGLKWTNSVEPGKRYEMGILEDLTFFIRVHPPAGQPSKGE
jgi:hypothetical protein